jgi:HNH endonuclease
VCGSARLNLDPLGGNVMPKTKHSDIVKYWGANESECGLAVDWAEAHERCWRCGYKSVLHRCHNVPASLGGVDEPSNLVLLCGRCHREAPNVTDTSFMWRWLRSSPAAFYDTYWTQRGIEEFARIFKRPPFTEARSLDRVSELLEKELENVTIHFCEGHTNSSTIAWVIWRVEQQLLGKPPIQLPLRLRRGSPPN